MHQLPILGAVSPEEEQDSLLELIGCVPDQRKTLPNPQCKAQSKTKTKSNSRSSQPKLSNSSAAAPKRIAPPASQVQVEPQLNKLEEKPAPYGLCRVCSSAIVIPGLDASLCSNPSRTCGSSRWVTASQERMPHPARIGGAA